MELNKIFLIKLISSAPFYFFNVTTRKFTLHSWFSLYFYWTVVLQICFLQAPSSLFALILIVLPLPQDLCMCCFYSFLTSSHLTHTHLSTVLKPHFLNENVSDALVLVHFSYYLLSHHYEPHFCSICHRGNSTIVYLLAIHLPIKLSVP